MRVLIVHSHPDPDSYNASLMRTARDALAAAGHEVRVIDLHAEGFDPVLTRDGWRAYEQGEAGAPDLAEHIAHIRWAEGMVFVYPTWWYGLPAMLKGWLDRVWLPGVAFSMPRAGETIRPQMTHVRRLAVVTTCGASWWLTQLVGAPGKRLLLRGLRALMAPGCRTRFVAHYLMDSSTPESRERFRARVAAAMTKL
jgi:putative NADPH-quinone reductase